jgi:hypothetical protein
MISSTPAETVTYCLVNYSAGAWRDLASEKVDVWTVFYDSK